MRRQVAGGRLRSLRPVPTHRYNAAAGYMSRKNRKFRTDKFPFVSRIEFIRSKLSNYSAHVSGDCTAAAVRTEAEADRHHGHRTAVIMLI